jgi:hypothetical protein
VTLTVADIDRWSAEAGPDGYRLQIMAAAQPGYPPSLEAISPCFPGNLPDDRGPFPMVLTAN